MQIVCVLFVDPVFCMSVLLVVLFELVELAAYLQSQPAGLLLVSVFTGLTCSCTKTFVIRDKDVLVSFALALHLTEYEIGEPALRIQPLTLLLYTLVFKLACCAFLKIKSRLIHLIPDLLNIER